MCPKNTCAKSGFSDWLEPIKGEVHSEEEEDLSDLLDPKGLIHGEYLAALDHEFFTQFGAGERDGLERGDFSLSPLLPSHFSLALLSPLLSSPLSEPFSYICVLYSSDMSVTRSSSSEAIMGRGTDEASVWRITECDAVSPIHKPIISRPILNPDCSIQPRDGRNWARRHH